MNRLKTGIPWFDGLVEGGIPEENLVLLSGPCGAGKTIFGLQFLLSTKENGIYVSFEEEINQVKKAARLFGWDVDAAEKSGQIRFLKYDPFRMEDIIEMIESSIREISATRMVIDSVSAIGMYVKDLPELRRMILQISGMLRKNKCTSLLISEVIAGKEALSRFGVEEFVTDGVVLMKNFHTPSGYQRGMTVWKMRSTNHSRRIHPYEISKKGITVLASKSVKR